MKIYGSSKAAIYTLACEKREFEPIVQKKWCTVCFLRIYIHIHTSKTKHAQLCSKFGSIPTKKTVIYKIKITEQLSIVSNYAYQMFCLV